MAQRLSDFPETVMINGTRQPSPYIAKRDGKFWCLPCNVSLDNAAHLDRKPHKSKAWWRCFGRTDRGYEQRARAPQVDWDTREHTYKFWSNSPTDDNGGAHQGGDHQAEGGAHQGQFAQAAQQAQSAQGDGSPADPDPSGPRHYSLDDDGLVPQIAAAIHGLQGEITATKGEIMENLQGAATKIDIQGVATKIDTLTETIQGAVTKIDGAEAKIDALTEEVKTLVNIVSAMAPRGAQGLRALGGSASTGALTTPWNQHQ